MWQEVESDGSSPLLNIGEAHPGIPGPVLGCTVQETHGHSGAGPETDHENGEGTVASNM